LGHLQKLWDLLETTRKGGFELDSLRKFLACLAIGVRRSVPL
jgi:hypothetical protein